MRKFMVEVSIRDLEAGMNRIEDEGYTFKSDEANDIMASLLHESYMCEGDESIFTVTEVK